MICPDCKRPVSSHAAYRDGRCPVVPFYRLDQPGAPPTVFPKPLRACPPRELGQR